MTLAYVIWSLMVLVNLVYICSRHQELEPGWLLLLILGSFYYWPIPFLPMLLLWCNVGVY